jgi:hypothetical protein
MLISQLILKSVDRKEQTKSVYFLIFLSFYSTIVNTIITINRTTILAFAWCEIDEHFILTFYFMPFL